MSKKSIMITGVSTGIGLGTLSYFVKNGFHVYGSVRNSKDASRLKKIYKFRGVAQLGSASVWGAEGRWFKSSRPDQYIS